jgi:hypothetical protein
MRLFALHWQGVQDLQMGIVFLVVCLVLSTFLSGTALVPGDLGHLTPHSARDCRLGQPLAPHRDFLIRMVALLVRKPIVYTDKEHATDPG